MEATPKRTYSNPEVGLWGGGDRESFVSNPFYCNFTKYVHTEMVMIGLKIVLMPGKFALIK